MFINDCPLYTHSIVYLVIYAQLKLATCGPDYNNKVTIFYSLHAFLLLPDVCLQAISP